MFRQRLLDNLGYLLFGWFFFSSSGECVRGNARRSWEDKNAFTWEIERCSFLLCLPFFIFSWLFKSFFCLGNVFLFCQGDSWDYRTLGVKVYSGILKNVGICGKDGEVCCWTKSVFLRRGGAGGASFSTGGWNHGAWGPVSKKRGKSGKVGSIYRRTWDLVFFFISWVLFHQGVLENPRENLRSSCFFSGVFRFCHVSLLYERRSILE